MQRLKTRPQFQAVLAGSVIAKTEHFVLHRNSLEPIRVPAPQVTPEPDAHKAKGDELAARLFPVLDVWIGAMVPKRWAKRAVTRNTIKRQIYTVSAETMHNFPQAAFLVRLRREFSRKEFVSATSAQLKEAVRAEVLALMQTGATPK